MKPFLTAIQQATTVAMDHLRSLLLTVGGLEFWQQFRLIPAEVPKSGSIFGFAEYLSTVALLLVVMSASDFRFRYRLSLARANLRKIGFWICFGVGLAILGTDVWFQNGLPIPVLFQNSNNLKAVFSLLFLLFVFHAISITMIWPPSFSTSKAERFLRVNYRYIHEGNPERLQVIAEELLSSVDAIVTTAGSVRQKRDTARSSGKARPWDYAYQFLLLIGDRRFCAVVVDKMPAFAFTCFTSFQKSSDKQLPIFQFARNVGQEFVRNTNSSFYQEDSGYHSGLVGYVQPATNIIFGSYKFIEECAVKGASPLDTDHREFWEFTEAQMQGFVRASLSFLESYLIETGGRSYPHSYALARLLGSFKDSLSNIAEIDGKEDYSKHRSYHRLTTTVDFLKRAMGLVNQHAISPRALRLNTGFDQDIFDELAQVTFEAIFAASMVSSPPWTAWDVQHNAVWAPIFNFDRSAAMRVLRFKVRRLLYDEIVKMGRFSNFKGARILGYCLNVFGLKLINSRNGIDREFYPLHKVVLQWTKANYGRLRADTPPVADACLSGSLSYDAEHNRLVQTSMGAMSGNPTRVFLELN